tara:strand:- start:46 stop:1899 length:1854 start_codon:yes stop_codon:yes gene_type:complete
MAHGDCSICCEPFNLKARSSTVCNNPECGMEICKECIRTYLLGSSNDPHCMNCKTALNQEYLVNNLNRSFCKNEYKDHRTDMLVEREMGKMPESMPAAEKQKQIDSLREEEIKIEQEIRAITSMLSQAREKKRKCNTDIWRLETGRVKMAKKKFIMPCSVDDCRGFLSSSYKCEICDMYTCPDCLVCIGENRTNNDHVCDEKTKENAEFIKSTCKACPGMCGEFIFKIDGCDQMWCTTCHTAFSWRTGEIERGVVHNPHYYAALQNGGGVMPRAPGDVVCGGLPDFYHELDRPYKKIVRKILKRGNIDKYFSVLCEHELDVPEILYDLMMEHDPNAEDEPQPERNTVMVNYAKLQTPKLNGYLKACINIEIVYKELCNIHRIMNHITVITIADARTNIEGYRDNESLRVDYLLNKISKDKLAELVYKSDIKRQKCQEELYVWELLSNCAIDLFRDIAVKLESFNLENEESLIDSMIVLINNINDAILEFKKLIIYCNSEFKKIGITYGLVAPFISQHAMSIVDVKDRGVLRLRGSTDGITTIASHHLSNPQVFINMLSYLNEIVNENNTTELFYSTYNVLRLTTHKWKNKDKKKSIENIPASEGPQFNTRILHHRMY